MTAKLRLLSVELEARRGPDGSHYLRSAHPLAVPPNSVSAVLEAPLSGRTTALDPHQPSFYLVSAVQRDGQWQLPLAAETVLEWAWQR